jgi:DNA-binding CsgD family transcriptional regulator
LRTAVREAVKLDGRAETTLEVDALEAYSANDHASQLDARLEFLAAGETIAAAGLSERETRLVGLRASGYSYRESAGLTGQSRRTVERQLVRANRKLRNARSIGTESWR